jgi:hypothetical protein
MILEVVGTSGWRNSVFVFRAEVTKLGTGGVWEWKGPTDKEDGKNIPDQ